jgi:hypothetical protein
MSIRVRDIPPGIIAVTIAMLVIEGLIKLAEQGTIDFQTTPRWLMYVGLLVIFITSFWLGDRIWKSILEARRKNRT